MLYLASFVCGDVNKPVFNSGDASVSTLRVVFGFLFALKTSMIVHANHQTLSLLTLESLFPSADLQYSYLLLNGYILISVLGPVMYNLWISRVCNVTLCSFCYASHAEDILSES